LGHRKEEGREELQYAHGPINLARIPPLAEPRADIRISRHIDYRDDHEDRGQDVSEKMRKAAYPHSHLLSNRDC
jgi:hypothetical protein